MIRINLLEEEAEIDTNNVLWLIAYSASLIAVIVLFVGANIYIGTSISSTEDRVESRNKQLAQLKEKTKEVHELEAKRDELGMITLIIAALKKTQEGPVYLLDDMNSAVADRMWFQSASLKGAEMTIEGIALSDEIIVQFMRDLEKSSFINRVDLTESSTIPLVQLTVFNSQSKKETKMVIKGDKDAVEAKLDEIKDMGETMGLEFIHGMPEEDEAVASSFTSATRRPIAIRPTLFAWESFEPVKAKLFTAKLSIRLVTKQLKIEELLPDEDILDQESTDTKPGGRS